MTYHCLNPQCKKVFTHTATLTTETTDSIIEKHVCPFCLGLDFEEYEEPAAKLASVISVEIADVDAKLKEGYEVREVYAKNAVLQKKEKQA